MMRSLFAGVSALRNHQTRMDIIGNNIANVNTIGFKAGRVTFKEQLSQMLKGAGAATSTRGGTNPQQVGLGVDLGSITNIHTPGNLESTGVESDLAIEGEGFFILSNGSQQFYTRAGAFEFDENGSLVNPGDGLFVMGYQARDGVVDTSAGITPIQIPSNQTIPPVASTEMTISGNLDARLNGALAFEPNPITLQGTNEETQVSVVLTPTGTFNEWAWSIHAPGADHVAGGGTVRLNADGTIANLNVHTAGSVEIDGVTHTLNWANVGDAPSISWSDGTDSIDVDGVFTPAVQPETSLRVFDSRGGQHDIHITFEKIAANTWQWVARDESGNIVGEGDLAFDTTGTLQSQSGQIELTPSGADPIVLTPDLSRINQFAEDSDVTRTTQNGFPSGTLTAIALDSSGQIVGSFSNGLSQTLAQVALAHFTNPSGLTKRAGTLFEASPNSGDPSIGLAHTGSRGSIAPGKLEMSNVDLSHEFTNMIVTQRGFQANSRIITTSDEMLQELVNLKR